MPSRFDGPLQDVFAAEAAGALIHTAHRVRDALDALRKFDAEVATAKRLSDDMRRSRLVDTAADLFLGYIVQREAIGLYDADYLRKEYEVPEDVWLRLGATHGLIG